MESMGVMESVTEAMRHAASWKGATESDTCVTEESSGNAP